LKSIFVMALILLLVIPFFSIIDPGARGSDYPHDPRGEITDVDIVWSTCYQGETQAIYVVFRNPTSTTYPYLVSVYVLDPNNNVVYDSQQVGQDMAGYVYGGQSVTWGPWQYTLSHDAPNGTYHVLACLKLYPWIQLDFRGLSWCEPEETFLVKLSHETILGNNGGAYDSDGDGYNDTAWLQVLAMTNCQQDVNVWAGAVFKDPSGNVVSIHSTDVWTVPAAGQSWSNKTYFSVPVGSPVGKYSVDIYLFDTSHRNGDYPEDFLHSAQTYDPLYPLGYGAGAPPPTYNVTIVAHCNTEGSDVAVAVTEDGVLTGLSTPYTFSGLTGFHNFTVPSADVNGHAFRQWSTGSTSTTIAVNSGGTYTAYYEEVLGPIVSISPPFSSLMVGGNVTIAVKVSNVTNLFLWQIKLYFNSSGVNCTGAWYPDSNIFAGKSFVPAPPDIEQNYEMCGASLLGNARFDGSGILCLINFTGLNEGNYSLRFVETDTFLQDSDLNSIPLTIIQGSLAVLADPVGRATDVNHDGKVDMKDLGLVCRVFNTSPEDPNWNPACDVNHDGKVDMKDIGLVARDFGKTA